MIIKMKAGRDKIIIRGKKGRRGSKDSTMYKSKSSTIKPIHFKLQL